MIILKYNLFLVLNSHAVFLTVILINDYRALFMFIYSKHHRYNGTHNFGTIFKYYITLSVLRRNSFKKRFELFAVCFLLLLT